MREQGDPRSVLSRFTRDMIDHQCTAVARANLSFEVWPLIFPLDESDELDVMETGTNKWSTTRSISMRLCCCGFAHADIVCACLSEQRAIFHVWTSPDTRFYIIEAPPGRELGVPSLAPHHATNRKVISRACIGVSHPTTRPGGAKAPPSCGSAVRCSVPEGM